jgi:hypothetical protein
MLRNVCDSPDIVEKFTKFFLKAIICRWGKCDRRSCSALVIWGGRAIVFIVGVEGDGLWGAIGFWRAIDCGWDGVRSVFGDGVGVRSVLGWVEGDRLWVGLSAIAFCVGECDRLLSLIFVTTQKMFLYQCQYLESCPLEYLV